MSTLGRGVVIAHKNTTTTVSKVEVTKEYIHLRERIGPTALMKFKPIGFFLNEGGLCASVMALAATSMLSFSFYVDGYSAFYSLMFLFMAIPFALHMLTGWFLKSKIKEVEHKSLFSFSDSRKVQEAFEKDGEFVLAYSRQHLKAGHEDTFKRIRKRELISNTFNAWVGFEELPASVREDFRAPLRTLMNNLPETDEGIQYALDNVRKLEAEAENYLERHYETTLAPEEEEEKAMIDASFQRGFEIATEDKLLEVEMDLMKNKPA